MSDLFRVLTPMTYWVLIILWTFILGFYVKNMWGSKTKHLFASLIAILAVDAFRTLFESIYFGAWYTSLAGFIPQNIGDFLTRPEMVIVPKLINVFAACIVIFLLLRRWLPEEEQVKIQSDEALRASEEKFRAFTDQAFECISVADPAGNYTYTNPSFCRLMGYSAAELLKMTVFDVTSDSQDKATFARSKGSEEGEPIQVVLKRKNGTDFLAEVVGKTVDIGTDRSVLVVVRDISERAREEQEMLAEARQTQHAQKLESLGVLAGGIAHDFNNLLTAILGNASLAIDGLAASSPARENIEAIEQASKRAAELAKQMLAYSGRGQFVIEPIAVEEIVGEISHLLEVSVPKKITLRYDYGPDTPMFDGDATQVRQVIMNLITNAADAIGEQRGVISLTTGAMDCSRNYLDGLNLTLLASLKKPLREGVYSYIEVTDTGCGMDSETLDRIFDPFFSTKFAGRGLGMSAVLGIVRGHQGALEVQTEMGRGTTFRVLFPVSALSSQVGVEAANTVNDAESWRGAGTVLIADDEECVRNVARRMVDRMGFQVLLAADGRKAVQIYAEHAGQIECVLLDLTMPLMDGEEAFLEIRRLDPAASVLLCSGYNEQEITQSFTEQGLVGFVHKPYEFKTLRTQLRLAMADRDGED